jgi:hypothetical protein
MYVVAPEACASVLEVSCFMQHNKHHCRLLLPVLHRAHYKNSTFIGDIIPLTSHSNAHSSRFFFGSARSASRATYMRTLCGTISAGASERVQPRIIASS